MGLFFEWDPAKAAHNEAKHKVSFSEACTVFADPLSITVHDDDLSEHEHRFITIGHSTGDRLIVVIHSDRGDRIRIISARQATKGERQQYEEGDQ